MDRNILVLENTVISEPYFLFTEQFSRFFYVLPEVCIRANVAHQAGAYPGFCSMKRLGVFLLPPGWDTSPSQGYPPALSLPVPIYTPGWREAPWEWSVLPKNTTQCPRPGLEPGPLAPGTNALTIRPLRLPQVTLDRLLSRQPSGTDQQVKVRSIFLFFL